MESTREQVLRLVRGHHEATVAQVAATLGLSPQAVRRHLDGLRADGLVDVRLARHGVGRPALLFFATAAGSERSGRSYVQLMSRLFRHLAKGSDQAGGRRVLESVFAGIAQEVAADHEAEVRGTTLGQRVAEVSQALASEGIVDGWREQDGDFALVNSECPYLRLAEMSDAPCRADQQSIALLVGAPVEQTKRIVDGSPVCEYVVRAEKASATKAKAT